MRLQFLRERLTFANLVAVIALKARYRLTSVRAGPADIGFHDFRRVTEANFLTQRIGSKASSAFDGSINRAWPGWGLDLDFNAGTDCGLVGWNPRQFQFDPAVCIARIQKQGASGGVACVGAPLLDKHFLGTIIIEVGESAAWPFWIWPVPVAVVTS